MLNHIAAEAVIRASKLIQKGNIVDLSIELGSHRPATGGGGVNPIHLLGNCEAASRLI